MFRATLLVFTILTGFTPAMAGPKCTDEPKSVWLDKDTFVEMVKSSGIKVEVFKITKGNCYEIYGRNPDGLRIEVYYHPVTGAIVRDATL